MQARICTTISLILAVFLVANVTAKNDGLAKLPPMGWNSWNCLGPNDITETNIKAIADAIVSSGMRDAGYTYVVLDDGWMNYTRLSGNLAAHTTKFPKGMKDIGDYLHDRGLKFGIYLDAGTGTCQNRGDGNGGPGSLNNFRRDVALLASWGVDYIKMDWCNTASSGSECLLSSPKHITQQAAFDSLSKACDTSGRKIMISMCEWGQSSPWTWAAPVAHLWRTNFDLIGGYNVSQPTWGCGMNTFDLIADLNADPVKNLPAAAGPGHWNDPDMLQAGNIDPSLWCWGGAAADMITVEQSRSHFSLWCILAAPLMTGNHLAKMINPPSTSLTAKLDSVKAILTNIEAIAVDQDRAGLQGTRVRDNGATEVWVRKLHDSSRVVVVFNRGTSAATINVSMADIGFSASTTYQVRNIWKKTSTTHSGASMACTGVPGNGGCAMYRIGTVLPTITTRADFDTSIHATAAQHIARTGQVFQRGLTVSFSNARVVSAIALRPDEFITGIDMFDLGGRRVLSIRNVQSRNREGAVSIAIAQAIPAKTLLIRCMTKNRVLPAVRVYAAGQ